MKAPAKLKIGNQEFVREDLVNANPFRAKAGTTVKTSSKTSDGFVYSEKGRKALAKVASAARARVQKVLSEQEGIVVKAKVKIPRELWAPIYKKIGDNKKLVSALKKLLKAGEPAPLMEFAKTNDLDYSALRKIMSLVNPELHVGEVLSAVLAKAVRALKDAGVVDPIKIEQASLWKAWLKAVDEDAQS